VSKLPVETTNDEGRGLSTQDWIDVARAMLLKEGVNSVKIDRLARECGVTRGGFYWRFKSRGDLLDALLEDWKNTNSAPILEALKGPGSPAERFERLVRLWIDEQEYSPDYDTAIRNWARTDVKVQQAVHEVDNRRVEALQKLFKDFGFAEDEALVRARVTYYHQVGYYAMEVREAARRREELSQLYTLVLTGQSSPTPVKR